MTTFVIGAKEYEVGPLVFSQIKRIWTHISAMAPDGKFETIGQGMVAGFKAVDAACEVVAVLLEKAHPEMTAKVIEDSLLPKEVNGLTLAIQELIVESGLAARPQAPVADQEQRTDDPGQVTGTPSLQNSSDQDVEAGTK